MPAESLALRAAARESAARALTLLLVLAVPAEALDKLFFVGPMKTGTTTLSQMLKKKGYSTCHGARPRHSGAPRPGDHGPPGLEARR